MRLPAPPHPLDFFGLFVAADAFAPPPQANEVDVPPPGVGAGAGTNAATPGVRVGSQGDQAMQGPLARATFAVTGSGVKVGVLSNSFNLHGGYRADVAADNLPANVQVLQEGPAGGSDEGRAMAQLVHQVAPDASLAFYSAFRSEADFAKGIKALAASGCKVIVDDVTYLDEPFFQAGGAVQAAIASVVAGGVSYFTSASNQGANFYEHGFTGVTAALPGLKGSYKTMNFGTAEAPRTVQSLTIAKGGTATIDLQWDQPFASISPGHGAANSLALVLYDATGKIVASALTNRTGGDPVQILRFANTTAGTSFKLGILANGGASTPGLLKYIVYGSGTSINDPNAGIGSGTIIGHEAMAGANSVGAIAASDAPGLGGGGRIEGFSSVGPGLLLFDSRGNRLSTAISGNKVNFVAPDGVPTSVFNAFYGTSAAAPDAAGIAALMLQANQGLAPGQISAMLAASAVTVSGPACGTGAGLIQAPSAVQQALAGKVRPGAAPGPGTGGTTGVIGHGSLLGALAAMRADPTANADFFVQPIAGALAPDTQITTATAFAVGHALGDQVIPILADAPTHLLV